MKFNSIKASIIFVNIVHITHDFVAVFHIIRSDNIFHIRVQKAFDEVKNEE